MAGVVDVVARGGTRTGHAQTPGKAEPGQSPTLLLEIRCPTRVQHTLNIFLHGDRTHINSTLTIFVKKALLLPCESARVTF